MFIKDIQGQTDGQTEIKVASILLLSNIDKNEVKSQKTPRVQQNQVQKFLWVCMKMLVSTGGTNVKFIPLLKITQ